MDLQKAQTIMAQNEQARQQVIEQLVKYYKHFRRNYSIDVLNLTPNHALLFMLGNMEEEFKAQAAAHSRGGIATILAVVVLMVAMCFAGCSTKSYPSQSHKNPVHRTDAHPCVKYL